MLIDSKDLKIVLEEKEDTWEWKILRKSYVVTKEKDYTWIVEETGFGKNEDEAFQEAKKVKLKILGWI